MSYLDATILGLVQGIAEFLPISSTGHLILARDLLGLQIDHGLAVDAILHFATAFAVLIYFRVDLLALLRCFVSWVRGHTVDPMQRTLLIALAAGTVPAVIAGLYLEKIMDTMFRSALLVAWVLIGGSILFLVAEYVCARYTYERAMTVGKGVLIGMFQALALVPGVSRSGATIAGGMLLGLSRAAAARFAFLLSLPIIVGAGSKKLLELNDASLPTSEWEMIGLAAFVAFVSGVASIHYLLKFLRNNTLVPFVLYRLALALIVFAAL